MNLSSGQQRALFVVIVVVLAGLGIYLIGPGGHEGASAGAPAATASASPAATYTPPVSVPAASGTPGASATLPAGPSSPAPSGTASLGKGQANIYDWLPFTQSELTSAARVALAFGADYGTWSYTESARAYVATMRGLVTPEFATTLEATFAPPGVLAQRQSQKQVSAGSAGITQLAAYGPGSITLDVSIAQKLTSTTGIRTDTTSYAVTLVAVASGWEADNIQLAKAGDFGAENP
jgi:hypothetical protein